MKTNEKGFSAVEGLLVLIIVGLTGFVGWYVWHSKVQTEKNLNQASNASRSTITPKTTKPEAKPAIDASANWLVIKSSITNSNGVRTEYQIRTPDGWEIAQFSKADYTDLFSNKDNLSIKNGTKAQVTAIDTYGQGKDNWPALDISFGTSTEGAPIGAKQTPIKTAQGLEITKRYASKQVDPSDLPDGLNYYYEYFLENKSVVMMCQYRVSTGQNDYHENVEKALKTLVF